MELKELLEFIKEEMLNNESREIYVDVEHESGDKKMYSIERKLDMSVDGEKNSYIYLVNSLKVPCKDINRSPLGEVKDVLAGNVSRIENISPISVVLRLAGKEKAMEYARRLWLLEEVKKDSYIELYRDEKEIVDVLVKMNKLAYNPYSQSFFNNDEDGWNTYLNDRYEYFKDSF